jgi:hypothetical protein
MKKAQLDELVFNAYQTSRKYSEAVALAEALVCGNDQRHVTPENVGAFLKASHDIYSIIPAQATPVHELLVAFGWEFTKTMTYPSVGRTHFDTEHYYTFWKCQIVVNASVGWHCVYVEPNLKAGHRRQKLHSARELANYLNHKMQKLVVEKFAFAIGDT